MKNIVCVISGPTASGKTSTSIQLAKEYGGEIVNFDSLLFYKEITIGTAKPTLEEQDGIPHHLVSCNSVTEPMNAADFSHKAIDLINSLHKEDKIVYLVGGSGFYLQAVLKGMYDSNTSSAEVLERSEQLYQKEGIDPFRKILSEVDSDSYNQYHENDHYRNRRAVEHFWHNGTKFSEERQRMKSKDLLSPQKKFNWNVHHIHLDLEKEKHFEIVQKRTNQMINEGLLDEVHSLIKAGFTGEEKPLKSIGYKETFDYILRDRFKDNDELIERINISTRQLAKSQRTWFSKVEKSTYNPLFDINKIKNDYALFLKEKTQG